MSAAGASGCQIGQEDYIDCSDRGDCADSGIDAALVEASASADGGENVTVTIGPAGGLISVGTVTVTIPPNALLAPTPLTLTRFDAHSMSLTPHVEFQVPVTVHFDGLDADNAYVLHQVDDSTLEELGEPCADGTGTSFLASSFTCYDVIDPANVTWLADGSPDPNGWDEGDSLAGGDVSNSAFPEQVLNTDVTADCLTNVRGDQPSTSQSWEQRAEADCRLGDQSPQGIERSSVAMSRRPSSSLATTRPPRCVKNVATSDGLTRAKSSFGRRIGRRETPGQIARWTRMLREPPLQHRDRRTRPRSGPPPRAGRRLGARGQSRATR